MAALDVQQLPSIQDRCADPTPPELNTGIEQFNRREFYECHETLEAIWLVEPDPVRRLYQGILQVGVAFYHLGRGNSRGASGLLVSGLAYLESFPAECQGVDVAQLIEDTRRAQTALADLGPDRLGEFDWSLVPIIRLVGPQPADQDI